MASGWSKLKTKLNDKDLDAEFEKFLNESLSDESVTSPRRSVTAKVSKAKANQGDNNKATTQQKFDKPWWENSEDDDNSASIDGKGNEWLKRKDSNPSQVDVVDVDDPEKNEYTRISKDSLDVNNSRPGTGLDTIHSEPEYSFTESVSKKSDDEAKGSPNNDNVNEAEEKNDEYSIETSHVETSPEHLPVRSTLNYEDTNSSDVLDKDTLYGVRDIKNTFPDAQEEKESGGNEDEPSHRSYSNRTESEGVAVEGLQAYPVQYSDDESTRSESRAISSNNGAIENGDDKRHERPSTPLETSSKRETDQHSQDDTIMEIPAVMDKNQEARTGAANLLSKVTLMESLDSTGGLLLAEKLERKSQVLLKSKTSEEDIALKTGNTTAELADALRNLKHVDSHSFDQAKDLATKEPVITSNIDTAHVQSGKLLLDQKDSGNLPRDSFNLQPVVSNYAEEPKFPTANVPDESQSNTSFMKTQPELNQIHTFSDVNKLIESTIVEHFMDGANRSKSLINLKNSTPNREQMGFSLKPIGDNESVEPDGFSLEPIIRNTTEQSGFSLKPISSIVKESVEDDSPPTDSLKSIKSIAEERKRKLKEKSKHIQADIKGAPSGRPTKKNKDTNEATTKRSIIPNYQKALNRTPKKQEPTTRKNEDVRPKKPPKVGSKKSSPSKRKVGVGTSDIVASIEILSKSLREFQYSSAHENSMTEGERVITRESFSREKDSHISALHREHGLQSELRELRLLYDDCVKENEMLRRKIFEREKEFEISKEKQSMEYDRRLKDLHEELYVLRNKLEMMEQERNKADNLKTKDANELSKEDVERLQKQVSEQEALLNGYQQENERLYEDLKRKTSEKKKMETKMFEENQKLASEVGNLKEQLELRPKTTSSTEASLGAAKITQLTNQVKFYRTREDEHRIRAIELENEVSTLQTKLTNHEKNKAPTKTTDQDLIQQIEQLETAHRAETEKLTKKLKWYSENQDLLDRDISELKEKREEITELRSLIERLEKENKKFRHEKSVKKSEKNSDDLKIKDLQRQVKEMEDIIKRRHPNSIPALIYAASAVPGEQKVYESLELEQSKNISAFLEKRIKQLEKELEVKDEENSRKVRAIEQRYNAMNLRYEEHTKQLENRISELLLSQESNASLDSLHAELAKQKSEYDDVVYELRSKIKEYQSKLNSTDKNSEEELRKTFSKPNSSRSDTTRLKTKLKNKENEVSDLKTTIHLLKRERETLLEKLSSIETREQHSEQKPTSPKHNASAVESKRKYSDQSTSPLIGSFVIEKYEQENKRLKEQATGLQIELKEQQLHFKAKEAETISEQRRAQEKMAEQLRTIEDNNERRVDKLKMEFAVDHSNSKVAELNGKLKSNDMIIEHLKGQLEEWKEDKERIERFEGIETSLRRQIKLLQSEVEEATKSFTPEMHHYKTLESKLSAMEARHTEREKELQHLVEVSKSKAAVDFNYAEDKWRKMLQQKDSEVQIFREELDSIIEVLEELKRQGIILPC